MMLFLNHSCEPNVGFGGNIVLVAMSDIEAEPLLPAATAAEWVLAPRRSSGRAGKSRMTPQGGSAAVAAGSSGSASMSLIATSTTFPPNPRLGSQEWLRKSITGSYSSVRAARYSCSRSGSRRRAQASQ